MAPELRRSAIYVILGCTFLAFAAYGIGHFVLERPPSAIAPFFSVLGVMALVMIAPLRWTLRIDETGVARRWLWRWDHWSWNDFASGRIEKRPPFVFVDRGRPWWRARLSIGYLSEAEVKVAIGIINEHYQMPASAPVADRLVIRYGLRTWMTATKWGIIT
jgi:hypothetical protein